MSPVLSRSRPPTLGAPRRRAAGIVVVAIVVVAVVASIRFLPQPMATGDLTVVNPHPWAARVEVGAADGASIAVGAVPREQTRTFTDVPEPGDVLALRFHYLEVSVELRVDREQLAASARVEVPAAFGRQLSELGVPPTPPVR